MAEEKLEVPKNPEKIVIKSNHARRNSTGSLNISKGGLKIPPRYLGPSWGSCHDFCKYGVVDSIEKKARNRIPRQIKPKASPDSKSLTNEKHQDITKEAQASAKKVAVSLRRFSLPGNIMDICAEHFPNLRPKPEQIKLSSSSSSTLADRSSRRNDHICTSKVVGVLQESPVGGSRNGGGKEMKQPKSWKKEDFASPAVSPSCRPSVKRELSAKSGSDKDPKSMSHTKDNGRKAEREKTIDQSIPEKTVYVVERKLQKRTENAIDATHLSESLYPSFEDNKFDCDGNKIHSSGSTPSLENKQLRHSRNGGNATHPSSMSPLSTYQNSLRCTQNGKLILNTQPSTPTPKTAKSDECDSFSGSAIKTKRLERVSSGDKVGLPEKMNFRRGKVDDSLSNTCSPRKLRFKQRRVFSESQNGKADSELRSLKEVVAIEDFGASKPEPTKVVLKHEDVEGQKCDQNLFNNVIEETAGKLVQTRKSRVRALVHAFETVILLQDTKSSAKTNVSRVD